MKTITIRGIDASLANILKQEAQQKSTTVNQIILETLKSRFGLIKEKKYTKIYNDMDHLFGKWSESEYKKIQAAIDSGRVIDWELWKRTR